MGLSNLEVIRDQYAATNERDWERAMSHYAEDVVLDIRGTGIAAGREEGREAVGRWFGDWFQSFDRNTHFDIKELEERDDGRVMLAADLKLRGRSSGVTLEGEVVWLYTVEEGKIVHVEGTTQLNEREGLGL